jgi:hypothetical protein
VSPPRFVAAALVLGLAVVPAAAQTREIQNEVNAKLAAERARLAEAQVRADRDQASRERYEEIEIMARLLDRGLGKLHGIGLPDGVHAVAFSPDGTTLGTTYDGGLTGSVRLWDVNTGRQVAGHAGVNLTGVQGVYLKGQGIVFTTTIPQHFQKAVGGANKPAPKALTPWERVRKELRGEKVEAETAKPTGDTSIADTVLKVLAENGKNLTRLPEGENVTVALTLLPVQACAKCHGGKGGASGGMSGMMGSGSGGMMGGMGGMMGSGSMGPGMGGSRAGGLSSGSSSGSLAGGAGSSFGSSSGSAGSSPNFEANLAEFHKNALMGDLALKQKDYQQAVNAYRKAIDVKGLPEDSTTQLEMVEVATKLARAMLAQGKTANAERIVQGLTRATERIKGGVHSNKPDEKKPEMALPAKLIITVPKKYLDQVGTGRIDFNALRKEAASVEYLTFDKPAAEKPKGGGGSGSSAH